MEETIEITASERFLDAAEEWGERRLLDEGDAVRAKAEQALLEIEHLVSGSTEVEFEVDGRTIRHEPSEELAAFLDQQAAMAEIDPETVLGLHVELFARVFLDE